MARFKLTIEYDGGPYSGWQRQENGPSIQSALETAVQGCTNESPTIFGAGRTDAGVHALGQTAHFDLAREWAPDRLREAINAHLRPQPVAVLRVDPVAPEFDARGDAIGRDYRYIIINRRPPLTVDAGRAWRVGPHLDATAMHNAAQILVGKHDFTTFRAAECQAKSPVKSLDAISVARRGDRISIDVSARSFLHRQVRSFVGSLRLIGEGKWQADDLAQALAARSRARCGPVAPAEGLYLVGIRYKKSAAKAKMSDNHQDLQENI